MLTLPPVLYSTRDDCWKLADFGSACEATSKHLHTTRYLRGTACYRAPEVLSNERFNNKADMFALGCIIYEIVTGEKLFADDWAIRDYARTEDNILPDRWPHALPDTPLFTLSKLTAAMVERNPLKRPSATEALKRLNLIEVGVYEEAMATEEQDLLHSSVPLIASVTQAVIPTVQPRFRLQTPSPDMSPKDGGVSQRSGIDPRVQSIYDDSDYYHTVLPPLAKVLDIAH